ncbi:MAG: DUF5107 domain-containing protein [Thermoguttaceae bacterium]|nr:DUF5107 domain-containing protein [Thermoguttaceae bacterium]
MKLPLKFIAIWAFLASSAAFAAETTIKYSEREFVTYPYSAPTPYPRMTNYYPYFRFDGFTASPVAQKWQIIELENEFVSLQITPEIGGKIWTATDKVTGKPFIYENPVVKFRDVALRGPWTSGGLEMNAGIIGHAPTTSSPISARRQKSPTSTCITAVKRDFGNSATAAIGKWLKTVKPRPRSVASSAEKRSRNAIFWRTARSIWPNVRRSRVIRRKFRKVWGIVSDRSVKRPLTKSRTATPSCTSSPTANMKRLRSGGSTT